MSAALLPFASPRLGSRSAQSRVAVVASASAEARSAVALALQSLRWEVREVPGAAELFELLEQGSAVAAILDHWLPDLEVGECRTELVASFPGLEVFAIDGSDVQGARSPFRGELLHALRSAQAEREPEMVPVVEGASLQEQAPANRRGEQSRVHGIDAALSAARQHGSEARASAAVPELLGDDPAILEVSRRVELVARRNTPVLIHGATGTGKELVARAIHRLSGRGAFVAINCGAIPEHLIEAELFGHSRGAFTGATQSRVGRIEAAAGGTLFLDEVGELPPAAQCKLLRFLESGEIQRVGENVPVEVKVRVVAATHRQLGAMAREGSFRLDLLHRLSVFLIQTPALRGRTAALDVLLAQSIQKLAEGDAPKQLSAAARKRLHQHSWPGNVRELQHTLERAWILAGECLVIEEECIDFGEALL